MKVKLTEAGRKVADELEIPEAIKEQWDSIWRDGKLVLFMTYGMSLRDWDKSGTLLRELRLYIELAKHLETIYIVTYGDGRNTIETQYKEQLPKNIIILYNNTALPNVLYTLFAPWIQRNVMKNADYFKSNQMAGSWTAVIAKILFKKRLIIRQGYPWLQTLKEKKASFLKKILVTITEVISYGVADSIIVTTDRDKQAIVDRFDDLEPKIRVISNYIDTDLFKPDPALRIPKRTLYVGRMAHEKNLFSLISAVKGLDVELIMIGEGGIKSQLITHTNDSGIKNVTFLTTMKNEELVNEYQKAEIFILPSIYEGNPKVLMEAMACGCFVIGTNVRGIKEIIEDGKNGFLCEVTSPYIISAIRQVQFMLDVCSKEADEIREKARDTIVDKHSLQSTVLKELHVYRDWREPGNFEISDIEEKAMKEADERIHKDEEERQIRNQKVLNTVEEQVSKELFECIEYEISESGWTDDYKIIDEPIGGLQTSSKDELQVWIDQYSVGDSGDSWGGTVCVGLPNGKYLSWGYSI